MNIKAANWPAPKNVIALSTTRQLGFSKPPYDSNNLGLGIGDHDQDVLQNRQQLIEALQLPGEPQWLKQTHSTHCVLIEKDSNRQADASVTRCTQYPLVILTADCLPITLCNRQGNEIAAIHAGWRGLVSGIIENTLAKMQSKTEDLLAWIGPAICQQCYEVDNVVYKPFVSKYPWSRNAFKQSNSKWFANLPYIAELLLNVQGVSAVYQSGLCTFECQSELYSYRRNAQTGRIGTLIWFNNQTQD
jgi:YfiH family protein